MMCADQYLETLIHEVQANSKYEAISPVLIRRISSEALERKLSGKKAVKYVRNKLHQIGGAYFRQKPNYASLQSDLQMLPFNLNGQSVRSFCIQQMKAHASTSERLPILENFFKETLSSLAPVESVLDLACGLNPLAIPWMPLAKTCTYHAWDIYEDLLAFINAFFNHFDINGETESRDLLTDLPEIKTQVAFLLKTIPCLEQLEKSIGSSLLKQIPSNHILVSFPVHSLSGHKKGMIDFYRNHFYELLGNNSWEIKEFLFQTELAFLVTK